MNQTVENPYLFIVNYRIGDDASIYTAMVLPKSGDIQEAILMVKYLQPAMSDTPVTVISAQPMQAPTVLILPDNAGDGDE